MNKNQKRIREMFRKVVSTTKPEAPGVIQVPAGGYHNETKGRFTTRMIERAGFKHKRKTRPFPIPNPDADVRMSTQRLQFYGI